MKNKVYFSVIMPTLNSEKTLEKALSSITNQVFDPKRIEILILDGGSTDGTHKIAQQYGCRIISNPKIQQEYGKHLGILSSQGVVCLFLDSDEILEDTYSFKKREDIFNSFPDVKVLLFGGYKKPEGTSFINEYINYFSDPFTFFISGVPTEHQVIQAAWKEKYTSFEDHKNHTLFKINDSTYLPSVDMCAGNCFVREYYLKLEQNNINDPMIVPSIFYKIAQSSKSFGMLKNSPTVHYSADNLLKYIKKLTWRVKVNVHFKNIPGTGYSNREYLQPQKDRLRKYLFVPYAFSIVGPLIASLIMSFKYKKIIFLINVPLTLYVAFCIVYSYLLLFLGVKPKLRSYGKEEVELKL